jgi:hypothetical protein
LGKLSQSESQKLGYENIVALMGKESTYFLIEGGDDVLKIFNAFDNSRIKISNKTKLFVKDQKIWGVASLVYVKSNASGEYTDEEKTNLVNFDFVAAKTDGTFEKMLDIKGFFFKKHVPRCN